jgi:mono/diheme cytochrome c family protein
MTRIRPSVLLSSLAVLVAGAAFFASPALAQSGEERSVLDGVYSPEQASFGQEVYEAECALCHMTQEFTGRIFLLSWSNRSVHDLFRSIRSTMPFDRPGGLTDEQYTAIVSYLLKLNDFPEGDEEMKASEEALSQIKIEPPPNQ